MGFNVFMVGCSVRLQKGPTSITVSGAMCWYFSNIKVVVHGLVSQERWDKTRRLIVELVGMEWKGSNEMPKARMESIRGF